jgi:hypothetical protein
MKSEKPGMAAGLRDGSTIKGNDHTDRIANAQAPARAQGQHPDEDVYDWLDWPADEPDPERDLATEVCGCVSRAAWLAAQTDSGTDR